MLKFFAIKYPRQLVFEFPLLLTNELILSNANNSNLINSLSSSYF